MEVWRCVDGSTPLRLPGHYFRQLGRQHVAAKGLLQAIFFFMLQDFRNVSGDVNDPELWFEPAKKLGKLQPVHFRHSEIGYKQIDGALLHLKLSNSSSGIGNSNYCIAQAYQLQRHYFPNIGFVFHQKNVAGQSASAYGAECRVFHLPLQAQISFADAACSGIFFIGGRRAYLSNKIIIFR
jgi:hypothetical protein